MPHTLRSLCIVLAGSVLAACSAEGQPSDADTSVVEDSDSDPWDQDSADTDTDTSSPDQATWWELDGLLILQDQQASPVESSFVLELRNAELAELCSTPRDIASMVEVPSPAEPLYRAWTLALDEGEGCEDAVPTDFEIGIGPYDPRLDPATASHGMDPTALFGLYVRLEGKPMHVFGVAGTAEQFAGTPVEAPPLPDGAYTLDGLHLLPL